MFKISVFDLRKLFGPGVVIDRKEGKLVEEKSNLVIGQVEEYPYYAIVRLRALDLYIKGENNTFREKENGAIRYLNRKNVALGPKRIYLNMGDGTYALIGEREHDQSKSLVLTIPLVAVKKTVADKDNDAE